MSGNHGVLTAAELLKVRSKRGHHLVRLTPADAAKLLAYNTINRRLRMTWAKALATVINEGLWQDGHPQPIVFTEEGWLGDGQHRLHGLAASNPPKGSIVVTVETGVPTAVREFLDTGAPRCLADRVRIDDDLDLNKAAALLCATDHRLHGGNGKRANRLLPSDLKEFWEEHEKSIRFCHEVNTKRTKGINSAGVRLALMEMHERNPVAAREFYESIKSPTPKIQQAQALLNYLLQLGNKGKIGSTETSDVYERSITAMKAYLENREVKKLTRTSSW